VTTCPTTVFEIQNKGYVECSSSLVPLNAGNFHRKPLLD